MATVDNLFLPGWSSLDSTELRLLLNEKIGGSGQVDGDMAQHVPFYLPMADDTCQIILKFKNGKIIRIEQGESFNKESWKEIVFLIDGLLNRGRIKIGRGLGFSSRPVSGYWKGPCSNIQICPPPANAPQTTMHGAQNPFVLEFPIVMSGIDRVDSYRMGREYRKYCRVLNVILNSHIQFHGMRQRSFWAQLEQRRGSSELFEYRWVQSGYFADIGKVICDQHSSYSYQQIAHFDSAEYFSPRTYHGDSLTTPSNLDDLLAKYQNLSRNEQEKFDCGAYWFDLSVRQWELSASASFLALVSAIEAFVGRGQSHDIYCPVCASDFTHEVPGVVQRFKTFLEEYGGDIGLTKERAAMYALRSGIAHGSTVLRLDDDHYAGWDPVTETERDLQWNMHKVAKTAMINWLSSRG